MTSFRNFGPELARIDRNVKLILQILGTHGTPAAGEFNPPANLLRTKPIEVIMSVMELEVGQTAVGTMTFDEPTPPADGAVASDNPAVATISFAPDNITWTCNAVSVGVANMTYTGTSALPDVGPAVVPPMVVTVVAVPVAEHGDFSPSGAVITGP
jgi:hypothetical protein